MPSFNYHYLSPKHKDTPSSATLSNLDELSKLPINIVSSDRLCRIGKINLNQSFYLKTYCRGNGFLRDLFRKSKFDTEIRNQKYFSSLGIPTPEFISIGREASFKGIQRAYFVSEDLAPAISLLEFGQSGQLAQLHIKQRRALLKTLARYTKLLHNDGFVHLDLKWRNVLIDFEDNNKVYFIDCPAGYKPPKFALAYLANKDLACLDRDATSFLSKTDRLFFYKEYLAVTTLGEKEKALAYKIIGFFRGGRRKVRWNRKIKRFLKDRSKKPS